MQHSIEIKRIAEKLVPTSDIQDVPITECYVNDIIYQVVSWSKPHSDMVLSVRPAGELFFSHTFFITNLNDSFSTQAIVQQYQKRGTMKNFINETKAGLALIRTKVMRLK